MMLTPSSSKRVPSTTPTKRNTQGVWDLTHLRRVLLGKIKKSSSPPSLRRVNDASSSCTIIFKKEILGLYWHTWVGFVDYSSSFHFPSSPMLLGDGPWTLCLPVPISGRQFCRLGFQTWSSCKLFQGMGTNALGWELSALRSIDGFLDSDVAPGEKRRLVSKMISECQRLGIRAWSVTQMTLFGRNAFGSKSHLSQIRLGQMLKESRVSTSTDGSSTRPRTARTAWVGASYCTNWYC